MPAEKRIVMVGSIPPPYHGSNTYFLSLLNSELRKKYLIHHVDISDHRGLENMSRLDITNIRLALKGVFDLFGAVKKFRPDIVYIPVASGFLPFLRDGLFMITASAFSKAGIVIHLHEGSYFRDVFYERSSLPVKQFIRYALSRVDTAIVYSGSLKRIFEGLVRNTVAFPNGIDSDTPAVPKKFSGNPKISYVANLFESKGIITFLKASAIISGKFPGAEFIVAGGWGSDKNTVDAKIRNVLSESGISERVKFLGSLPVDKLQSVFQESTMLIFPTKYEVEGCPLVVIEAMMRGVPVISSRGVGAIPDMIDDGKDGFLADPDSPEEIADKACKLLNTPGLYSEISNNAIDRFEREFTMKRNIENVTATFESVMSKKNVNE